MNDDVNECFRSMAVSLRNISETLGEMHGLLLGMERRSAEAMTRMGMSPYSPDGLRFRQDGDHIEPQRPIPPDLDRHPTRRRE